MTAPGRDDVLHATARRESTFDPVQWERLRAAFESAVCAGGSERQAHVERLSEEDAALARLLSSLLSAHADADGATDSQRARWIDAATRTFESLRPGDRVGGFQLREVIGRGGMGVVYRAERVDGHVRQQVAIKFVQPMLLDEVALNRFSVERDAIAALRHPNIARLFDAGTTADGVPFAVMELVDGVPITDWCDQRRLDVRARLALLATVCDAVQSAHDGLILHRDIKPANVLVSPDGVVKLIDFGIAVSLDSTSVRVSDLDTPMTEAYAAPEQLRREPLDIRCDVYQLGALAHELMCGVPPAPSPAGQHASPPIAGAARPSRVAAMQPAGIAEARGERGAARLAASLRGDIDAIVEHCLHDRREQRYASAARLAEDLRRLGTGEPVAARQAETGYRVLRFLERRAAAIAAIVLALGLAGAWVARELDAAEAITRQADVLRVQKAVADRAADFAAQIFESADPSTGLSPSAPVSEVLQRASERIERDLGGDPAVSARLHRVLAESWMSIEEHDRALASATKAIEAATAVHNNVDEAIAAHLVAARAQGMLRMRAEAITSAARAVGLHIDRGDDDRASWRARLALLAAIASSSGRAAVVGQMEHLVASLAAATPPDNEGYATVAMQLARYRDQRLAPWGDGPRAEALARSAWSSFFEGLPAHDLRRVEARARLGAILENSGLREEGVSLLEQSLADYRRALGDQSVSAATTLIQLGTAHAGWGRREAAIRYFRDGRAMFMALEHGRPTEGAAVAAYSIAQQHAIGGADEHPAAVEAFGNAIRDAIASFGPWHGNTLVFRVGYADSLRGTGQWDEAMRQLMIADRVFEFRRTNRSRYLDLIEAKVRAGAVRDGRGLIEDAAQLALDDASLQRLEGLRALATNQ